MIGGTAGAREADGRFGAALDERGSRRRPAGPGRATMADGDARSSGARRPGSCIPAGEPGSRTPVAEGPAARAEDPQRPTSDARYTAVGDQW